MVPVTEKFLDPSVGLPEGCNDGKLEGCTVGSDERDGFSDIKWDVEELGRVLGFAEGDVAGTLEGRSLGRPDGTWEGTVEGASDGRWDCEGLGFMEGRDERNDEGCAEGAERGDELGKPDGNSDEENVLRLGSELGLSDGALLGLSDGLSEWRIAMGIDGETLVELEDVKFDQVVDQVQMVGELGMLLGALLGVSDGVSESDKA